VTPVSENPNIALVQRFFVAYAEHDLETMREEIFAPDVTWRIPATTRWPESVLISSRQAGSWCGSD
jgi:ketosteroid isomerase-like protein